MRRMVDSGQRSGAGFGGELPGTEEEGRYMYVAKLEVRSPALHGVSDGGA